jgi:hypothetical protein
MSRFFGYIMAEETKTNWTEICRNCLTGEYDFATLSDEMLIKCAYAVWTQIAAFNSIDDGSLNDCDIEYEDNTPFVNNEGAYLNAANIAKIAHNISMLIKIEMKARNMNNERVRSLFENIDNKYKRDNNFN